MILSGKNKSRATFLIFIGWLMYAVSYMGKVNYSANIARIVDYYGITKAEAGAVPTFFFFAYGIGQVLNGILCKRYNTKWAIPLSLFVSAFINCSVALVNDFAIVKWLWMINGFALSVLWPTVTRVLSENMPQKELGRSVFAMGTTVATGTILTYLSSSLFALFNGFKLSFFLATATSATVGVIWLVFYNRATSSAYSMKAEETDTLERVENVSDDKETVTKSERKILFLLIYVLCFCAIGVNLIKDGLTTWVPSILKEEYAMPDSLSIFLSVFLQVVAIPASFIALAMHKKIADYVVHCSVVFGIIAFVILLIIGSISLKIALLMLLGLMTVSMFASSLNTLITSVFPMFMRGKVNSGLYAGILNGFCYVGSALSSYGLGYIADRAGWTGVFFVLVGACCTIVTVSVVYVLLKRKLKTSVE